jgi:hypothetical protein
MKPGIELSIVYSDEHLLELRVRASNGTFTGQAMMYEGLDAPRALAEMLRGFPMSSGDVRNIQIGAGGQGAASLRFYCLNSAGHAAVEVRLRAEPRFDGRVDEAAFHVAMEAAAVDSFVEQLSRMSADVGAEARLEAATS